MTKRDTKVSTDTQHGLKETHNEREETQQDH